MDFFTHLVFGMLMYLLFLKEISFNYLFIAILFSTIPDLDVFLSPLRRKFNLKYLDHRGGSHSYVVGMVVSAIFALIYSPITGHPFIIIWIIGSLFYGLHVTMDIFTTTKIPCFYPFSKKEYSFYVEKAGSLFTMLLSVSFLVLSIPIHLDSNIFATYLNVYITLFLVYYIYRTISKNVLASKLKNNQKYFPGVLPVYYTVLTREMVGNELFFTIKKKAHDGTGCGPE